MPGLLQEIMGLGPASGLCCGYTMTRAILGDAIALVRGKWFDEDAPSLRPPFLAVRPQGAHYPYTRRTDFPGLLTQGTASTPRTTLVSAGSCSSARVQSH